MEISTDLDWEASMYEEFVTLHEVIPIIKSSFLTSLSEKTGSVLLSTKKEIPTDAGNLKMRNMSCADCALRSGF